ncbi:MAG: lamin tail domain-containing protein [Prolixibacteraceae bacterium]|nr:lamin tail domain-containing protein [Prolixibacteraceae bacterium]
MVYVELDQSVFVEGENIVCCEIHQASASSSDLSFDMDLSYKVEKEGDGEIYSYERIVAYNHSFDVALKPVFEETAQLNGIYINEIASISSSFRDEYNENSGFIELYNSNNTGLALYGFYLSDDRDNLERYAIPDSTVIPAKGFLVIYADGNTLQGDLHTYFKLDNDGDEVYLSQKSDGFLQLMDSVKIKPLPKKYSYGKYTDGTGNWQYMHQTPGKANTKEVPDIALSRQKSFNVPALSIYPNPSTGYLNVEIKNIESEKQEYYIEITDLTGRVMIPKLWLNTSKSRITFNNCNNGIYLLHFYQNNVPIITKKIIIHRN